MNPGRLAGRRILVTRSADDAEPWVRRLAEIGARPVALPCLVFEPITDLQTARRLHDAIAEAQWLLLTSARGVRAVAHVLGVGASLRADLHIAVVGPATARAAIEHLGRADLVARDSSAAGLARELVARVAGDAVATSAHVVIAAAASGSDDAAAVLGGAGVRVTQVAVYHTVPAAPAITKRDLLAEGVEIVLLASPSAVTGLINLATVPTSARIITIGPTTSLAATNAGLAVAGEATRPTFEGILEAMA